MEITPRTVSPLTFKVDSTFNPLPKKLFSLTENPTVPPVVPTPAPSEISPVGFSSTLIFIIF